MRRNRVLGWKREITEQLEDFEAFTDKDVPGFSLSSLDPKTWHLTFKGPKDSPYCRTIFTLKLKFNTKDKSDEPFSFSWEGVVPVHPYFSEEGEKIDFLGASQDKTPKDVFLRIREVLMFPKIAPTQNSLFLKFCKDPDDYFSHVAQAHQLPYHLSPDLLNSWKSPQESANYLLEARAGIPYLSRTISDLKLRWTPRTNKFFLCPIWREIVFLLLAANQRYYGENILGIPTPLILEILEYVAQDFFEADTWAGIYLRYEKISDSKWVSKNSRALRRFQDSHSPDSTIQIFLRSYISENFLIVLHYKSTLFTVRNLLAQGLKISPERIFFPAGGRISLALGLTLSDLGHRPGTFAMKNTLWYKIRECPPQNFWR
jgi:hypothetical protein